MTDTDSIEATFPRVSEIEDESLRTGVVSVLGRALEEGEYASFEEMPWWPPYEDEVGDVRQVDHVREVTTYAIAIADAVAAHRDVDLDRDLVVAGALLHDVSKSLELGPDGMTDLDRFVPHPHYAVHLLAAADLPLELQNLVLSHSGASSVEPETLEAYVVQRADRLASNATFWARADRLNL